MLGARVVLVGRDQARLDELRAFLVESTGEDRYPAFVADMASLAAVRRLAAAVRAAEPRLDVLVDNAGAIYPERTVTRDGIEASMALHGDRAVRARSPGCCRSFAARATRA